MLAMRVIEVWLCVGSNSGGYGERFQSDGICHTRQAKPKRSSETVAAGDEVSHRLRLFAEYAH